MSDISAALVGGLVIGLATSLLLLIKGRVFGISGILGGLIKPSDKDLSWRAAVMIGLIVGGVIAYQFLPESFPLPEASTPRLIAAGLLVGFGTQLGSGCTSGHGVCGISRFSIRSIAATLIFMAAGIVTVYFF